MSEQAITDAVLRHALELQRVSAYEADRAEVILRELESDLRVLLTKLSGRDRREVKALIKAANDAIQARYVNVAGIVDTAELIEHVAGRTEAFIAESFPATALRGPSATRLASLAKTVLIDGSPAAAWWSKQAEDTAFKFAGIIRRGVANGETLEQMVRKVAGGRGEPGLMPVARRNARALVHSSVMTAANRARMETYREAFGDNAKGVRWMATLDSHTCKTCAALDGSEWDFDGKPISGTRMDFKLPPAHFACRCIATPVLNTKLDDIFGVAGLDELLKPTVRASSQGPVKNMTFAEFLKRQNPEFINDVLGEKRAAMYRAGKITLADLVSGTGRPLSLAELKAR